jgi:ribosomal protein S18 acetylase RimI-like enzyme
MSIIYSKINDDRDAALQICDLLFVALPKDPFLILLGKKKSVELIYSQLVNTTSITVAIDTISNSILGFISFGKSIPFEKIVKTSKPSEKVTFLLNYIKSWENFKLISSALFFFIITRIFRWDFPGNELIWIAVHPNFHRSGLGSELVLNSGILDSVSWVKTLKNSEGAIEFYEKFGYRLIRESQNRVIFSRDPANLV